MTEQPSKDQNFISKLTEIIQANLENKSFDVEELAHQFGMSHYTLSRRIYEITNKTASQFIRETRLLKALEMLQNEEFTAAEVAYKLGFSSPAYFNTCFHGFFGYPPGTVKKADFNTTGEKSNGLKTDKKRQKQSVRSNRLIYIIWSGILFSAFLVYLIYIVFFKSYFNEAITPFNKWGKSIAVLPFKNLSDSTNNRYFIDGLMEDILTDLSRIHDLRVISRSSVEQFRESTKSASEIAKKLHVNYIVEGSGQKYGNTFLLRVQLIEASKDRHIWAESYEQEIQEVKNIFNIQSHIAQEIASELKATITPEEKQMIEKTPTTNLTAYDFYQQGRDEYVKSWIDNNKVALQKAEGLYHKALKYDSTFALAYTSLAWVYWDKHYFQEYLSDNFLDSVLILANIALSHDYHLSEAYTIRGKYYFEMGKPEQAIEEYDKAIKLNPNDWIAYLGKGDLYFNNDFVNTINYYQKAISINRGRELPSLLRQIGFTYFFAGFPEKAKQYFQDKLKLDGDSSSYYDCLENDEFWLKNFNKSIEYGEKGFAIDSANDDILLTLGMGYEWLGQYKEALNYYKKYLARLKTEEKVDFANLHRIGYTYWQNGYKKEAEYFFDEQIEYCKRMNELDRPEAMEWTYYSLAGIYAFSGEKDKAYKNLRIFDQRKRKALWMPMLIKTDPLFNSIRNEREFQSILNDMEAKYQAEHKRVSKWLEERGEL